MACKFNQNIFDGYQTINSIRSAELGVLESRAGLRASEQNTLLDGVTAYMDVLRDTALLDLQRNNVQVLQEQLRETRDRFTVGEVTRTDVRRPKRACRAPNPRKSPRRRRWRLRWPITARSSAISRQASRRSSRSPSRCPRRCRKRSAFRRSSTRRSSPTCTRWTSPNWRSRWPRANSIRKSA